MGTPTTTTATGGLNPNSWYIPSTEPMDPQIIARLLAIKVNESEVKDRGEDREEKSQERLAKKRDQIIHIDEIKAIQKELENMSWFEKLTKALLAVVDILAGALLVASAISTGNIADAAAGVALIGRGATYLIALALEEMGQDVDWDAVEKIRAVFSGIAGVAAAFSGSAALVVGVTSLLQTAQLQAFKVYKEKCELEIATLNSQIDQLALQISNIEFADKKQATAISNLIASTQTLTAQIRGFMEEVYQIRQASIQSINSRR
ncbi:MAG: hypothetical protein Q7U75_02545 [Desulfobacterales bacterium]|nr:hypothetical protein [Desulfobacterales bacterium]